MTSCLGRISRESCVQSINFSSNSSLQLMVYKNTTAVNKQQLFLPVVTRLLRRHANPCVQQNIRRRQPGEKTRQICTRREQRTANEVPTSAAARIRVASGAERLGKGLETSSGHASGDDNRTQPPSSILFITTVIRHYVTSKGKRGNLPN